MRGRVDGSSLPTNQSFGVPLLLIFIGTVFCSLFRLPLIWDGAEYALANIAAGGALIPSSRVGAVIFQVPTLVSLWFRKIDVSLAVFSFSYGMIPFISLWGVSILLRKLERADLFIWPLLHLSALMIWGQAFFVSENLISCYLFWPVLLWTCYCGVVLALVSFAYRVGLSAFALERWP